MPGDVPDKLELTESAPRAAWAPELLSLWRHQRQAIVRMREYLTCFAQGLTAGSALVHMPTGSGKTGVIATLARCVPESRCVLVLTPRIALRQQLVRDVSARFFERLDAAPDPAEVPKVVVELDGPFRDLKIERIDETVLVSTIQKLQSMESHDRAGFEYLRKHVSLLMFDEGHYEPALTWSRTIRQFRVPKIIFTATPYRNDLKVFDLDLDHAFSYTYAEAVEDRYLREVKVVPREPAEDPEAFIEDVLAFYDRQFAGQGDPPRVIIRCDDGAAIRQLTKVLRHRGRTHVAIHERFADDGGRRGERRTVPDPRTEEATFWIHQFKLLEGIDDSRFQVLALYQPLRSARPLIQQIGRIIRNPARDPEARGYVLDHSQGMQTELWEGFLRYDSSIRDQGAEGLNLAVGQAWLKDLASRQPGLAYLDGRFRHPLDLDTLLPNEELLLPLRVNLLRKLDGFRLERCCKIVEQEYEEEDRLVRRYDAEEKTAILVYVAYSISPFLRTSTFVETRLGVTVIRELPDLVAFFDSQGYVPLNHEEAGIGTAVTAAGLKRLFPGSSESFLTHVSLKNSNLGTRTTRTRSFSAANVQETVCGFDDHAQICTTVTGYGAGDPDRAERRRRRYVGFESGRVAETSGKWGTLADYLEWLNFITATIRGRGQPLSTFLRYADEDVEVDDPTPLHVLLDLFEVEDSFVTVEGDGVEGGQALQVEERSCEVVDGRLALLANGVACTVDILYDGSRNRYELSSPDLEQLYRTKLPGGHKSVVDYLNREQSFRVIPATPERVYISGRFYRPIFRVGPSFDPLEFEVSKLLVPCSVLESTSSEKGDVFLPDESGWDPCSLFGILDDLGAAQGLAEHFGHPDVVICDDMRTEAADFIFAEQAEKRVIFVHAKASSQKRPYSASALHDVCGQATKNINYLGMFNQTRPPNLSDWERGWPDERRRKVARRIRQGPSSADEAWALIQSIVQHPWAKREVWLFLGQILSKSQLEEHLGRGVPTPEAVQAAYLLHGTMTTVASIGATLRVFCYP